jgi:hypothetical protein
MVGFATAAAYVVEMFTGERWYVFVALTVLKTALVVLGVMRWSRRRHERDLADGFRFLAVVSNTRGAVAERDILRAFSPYDRAARRAELDQAQRRSQACRARGVACGKTPNVQCVGCVGALWAAPVPDRR